jgi:hypothetical protein
MEWVHERLATDLLLASGHIYDEDIIFWTRYWRYIASAKVTLEAKIAAYYVLRYRGIANINNVDNMNLYEMVRADQAFVAALDLDAGTAYRYRLYVIWLNDDVDAFVNIGPASEWKGFLGVVMKIQAPRCLRYALQDKETRVLEMRYYLTPLVQRLVEELVQPTDQLGREWLLKHGQSVKLIGMCVPDEELVAAWLKTIRTYSHRYVSVSVMFARKLHALATPDQRVLIKCDVVAAIFGGPTDEGYFELAWLFGLLGPHDPTVQEWFLKHNINLFPALTFAMIVAMCDGYLKLISTPWLTAPQSRFLDVMMRLPMDLQALISLRLWEQTSTVIHREKFDRAFLAII